MPENSSLSFTCPRRAAEDGHALPGSGLPLRAGCAKSSTYLLSLLSPGDCDSRMPSSALWWHAVICSRAADSGWLLGIRDSIRLINKRRIPEEQCFNYQLLENNQLPPGKASSFFSCPFFCFF